LDYANIKRKTLLVFDKCLKLVIGILFIFPFYWMVTTAFKTFDETTLYPPTLWPHNIIFDNFEVVWNTIPFNIFTKNSVVVTLCVIILQLCVVIPAAFAFARYKFKLQGLLFGLVIVAFMVPVNVTYISIYLMFAKWGILNSLWPQIIPFGANAFGIFLLRQNFKQIPNEITEAAIIDGVSTSQLMLRIYVPMSKPTLTTIVLFSFVSHWNSYFWPLVMADRMEFKTLPLAVSMLKDIEGALNWEIIMAGNVVLVLPVIVVYFLANKQIIKAFSYVGIK
jgi:sn-glycerol 3-phosphate transport system permease protein